MGMCFACELPSKSLAKRTCFSMSLHSLFPANKASSVWIVSFSGGVFIFICLYFCANKLYNCGNLNMISPLLNLKCTSSCSWYCSYNCCKISKNSEAALLSFCMRNWRRMLAASNTYKFFQNFNIGSSCVFYHFNFAKAGKHKGNRHHLRHIGEQSLRHFFAFKFFTKSIV